MPMHFSHEENSAKIEMKGIPSHEVCPSFSVLLKSDRHSLFPKSDSFHIFQQLQLTFFLDMFAKIQILQANTSFREISGTHHPPCSNPQFVLSAVFQEGDLLIGFLRNALTPLKQFVCLTCVLLSLPFCCDSESWLVKLSA